MSHFFLADSGDASPAIAGRCADKIHCLSVEFLYRSVIIFLRLRFFRPISQQMETNSQLSDEMGEAALRLGSPAETEVVLCVNFILHPSTLQPCPTTLIN